MVKQDASSPHSNLYMLAKLATGNTVGVSPLSIATVYGKLLPATLRGPALSPSGILNTDKPNEKIQGLFNFLSRAKKLLATKDIFDLTLEDIKVFDPSTIRDYQTEIEVATKYGGEYSSKVQWIEPIKNLYTYFKKHPDLTGGRSFEIPSDLSRLIRDLKRAIDKQFNNTQNSDFARKTSGDTKTRRDKLLGYVNGNAELSSRDVAFVVKKLITSTHHEQKDLLIDMLKACVQSSSSSKNTNISSVLAAFQREIGGKIVVTTNEFDPNHNNNNIYLITDVNGLLGLPSLCDIDNLSSDYILVGQDGHQRYESVTTRMAVDEPDLFAQASEGFKRKAYEKVVKALDGDIKNTGQFRITQAEGAIKQLQKVVVVASSILSDIKSEVRQNIEVETTKAKHYLPALKRFGGVVSKKQTTPNMFSKFEGKKPKVSTLLSEAIKELRLK